jgi:hypothetical protein
MFNIGQRTAVAGAFKLAGYEGDLRILRVDDPTERWFVLTASDLAALRHVQVLEQVVGQILGCKVAIFEDRSDLGPFVPFE